MAKIFGQLENAQLENLSTDPGTAVAGRFYLNTTTGTVIVDDGTTKRSLLRNDGKAIFGTDASAANNVRFHRAGPSTLQFVPGNDTTAENAMATSLAQVGFRAVNLSAAPAVGNVGRIFYNTTTNGLAVDNGTTFLQFATLTGTETLTNKTLTTPKVDVITVTDQATQPTTPATGTLLYSRAGSFYKLGTDGLESQIGSGAGGAGAYNYLTNGDVESGVSTFQYATATLTNGIPTGTPSVSATANSITLSAETTNPLRRSTSLKATAASAWTAGHGFTLGPVFTLQQNDLAKILNVTVNYRLTTGANTLGYTGLGGTQGLQIAVYDVTANAWVNTPAGALGFNQAVGTGQVTATFQTSATVGQQYQVYVFNGVTSTAAVTALFDEMSVSPNIANSADSRSVTFIGVNSSQSGTTGANLSLTATLDRAGSWTGSAYAVSIAGDYFVTATGQINASPAFYNIYLNGTTVFNSFGSYGTGANQSLNGSIFLPNLKPGDLISVRPNVNATCNTTLSIFRIGGQSSGPDARVVAAKFGLSADASATANQPVPFNTSIIDTHSGFVAGGQYRVPVTGVYRLTVSGYTSAGANINFYRNAVVDTIVTTFSGGATTTGSTLIACVAGDLLDVRPTATVTFIAPCRLSIERLSGPTSVAPTESVIASYTLSAQQVVAVGGNAIWNTKVKDTHNMYSTTTGLITVPVSGQYRLSVVNLNASGNSSFYVKINNVAFGYLSSFLNTAFTSASISLNLKATDTVGVYNENTSVTLSAPAAFGPANLMSFERTGN